MIETIHNYVKAACEKPDNFLTEYFFKEHLLVVVEYGEKLCDMLHANKEIVSLSAYLHDISAVIDFKTLPTHNTKSAEFAEKILHQNNYSNEKISRVSQCIIRHISPLKLGNGTIEEVCLSNADAISQIVNPGFWLYFAFKIRNLKEQIGIYRGLQTIGMH